jgi:serine protease inhibitor
MTQGTGLTTRAGAVQRLGERWLRELGDGDFVCSPAGLWLVLAAVAAGARGKTAAELEALLEVAGEDAAVAVTEAARELAGTDALAVATRVWSRVPVYREYREALPGIGFASSMDPAETDAWVKAATDGLIERLPARIDDGTLLALVNALVLKARWAVPFSPGQTADLPFTDAAGVEHAVPTMRRVLRPGEAWTVGGTHVVELRCRATTSGGEPARVRFVLGEEGAGAADVLPAAWASPELRRWVQADSIRLALPRFSLRTTTEITPQLPALGVRTATTPAADFSGMSPERLAVSVVAQEAVVKVAELGVEAAAVSAVLMNPSGPPPQPKTIVRIAFDRPFGVAVLDAGGEVPLFVGWQAGAPGAPGVA